MIHIKGFTFNPFQENTYVLYDDTRDCLIIDPGCYDPEEKLELTDFIRQEKLKPVKLLNTHCHIDHVLGNKYVAETWGLDLIIHRFEIELLEAVQEYGANWGIFAEKSPTPASFIDEGDYIEFGNSRLEVIFTPGHSPGSVCFSSPKDKFSISGDVLFYQSIGRTDLPGGDYDTLINSIRQKMFALPDETKIYPGHGPATTIGAEKKSNPFLKN
ncbi:MAG: MBL fold metallo-hydrolase [Bacteroidia bacterium]